MTLFPRFVPTQYPSPETAPPATGGDAQDLARKNSSNCSGVAGPAVSNFEDTPHVAPRDPAPQIEAYHERLAICLEAGDIGEEESHHIAEREVGASLHSLANEQVRYWRHRLEYVAKSSDPWLASLARDCLEVLGSRWLIKATMMGWTEMELFGISGAAPRIRFEAMGLVPFLVSSRLGLSRENVEIDRSAAIVATVRKGSGSRLSYYRFRPNLGAAIWNHIGYR